MGFDLSAIKRAVEKHGRTARVVVAKVSGSAPREVGASMLVWEDGQSGTIGGGALEFEAVKAARGMLGDQTSLKRTLKGIPLGPSLGQCCGGSVALLTEVFTAQDCADIARTAELSAIFARPAEANDTANAKAPLSVHRINAQARATGNTPDTALIDGWMIEPFEFQKTPLWIYGAGHVGRALVHTLHALPFEITWIDTAADRFPDAIPEPVTPVTARNPGDLVKHAPVGAEHLILTYSHALDLELCHQILSHSFRSVGLIGSKTKWLRFRKRLQALGHENTQINRIHCPIGNPELGKSPQAIAVGVAAALLINQRAREHTKGLAK